MHNLHILKVSAAVAATTRHEQDQSSGEWLTGTYPQLRSWLLAAEGYLGRERGSVLLRVVAPGRLSMPQWMVSYTCIYMSKTSWMGYKKKKSRGYEVGRGT